MNQIYIVVLFILALFLSGCEKEKVSQHVAKLSVEFTWEGLRPCDWGNPEIHISGVPGNTKSLKISMYDHAYSHDHGTVQMPYAGEKRSGSRNLNKPLSGKSAINKAHQRAFKGAENGKKNTE